MKNNYTLLAILAILLAACTNTTPAPTSPTPAGSAVPSVVTPVTTQTAASSTPTSAPGKVLFVAPDPAAVDTDAAIQGVVSKLAAANQLTLESLTSLQPANLLPEVRIVVLLSTPDNLSDLLAASPRVQFVVIGQWPSLETHPNLSVITIQPEQAAYLAGFITTIISGDWRSAGLLPDTPAAIQDAFLNGGRYYCGRCIPIHGPIVAFPLAAALPAGSSFASWQNAVTQLQTKILQTVYVDPSISSPDLLKLLADQKLILVGGQSPSQDLRSQWSATVSSDVLTPLIALWPSLVAGTGGKSMAAALLVSDINPDYLTPGKQRLVQDVITGLQTGALGPLSIQ